MASKSDSATATVASNGPFTRLLRHVEAAIAKNGYVELETSDVKRYVGYALRKPELREFADLVRLRHPTCAVHMTELLYHSCGLIVDSREEEASVAADLRTLRLQATVGLEDVRLRQAAPRDAPVQATGHATKDEHDDTEAGAEHGEKKD